MLRRTGVLPCTAVESIPSAAGADSSCLASCFFQLISNLAHSPAAVHTIPVTFSLPLRAEIARPSTPPGRHCARGRSRLGKRGGRTGGVILNVLHRLARCTQLPARSVTVLHDENELEAPRTQREREQERERERRREQRERREWVPSTTREERLCLCFLCATAK